MLRHPDPLLEESLAIWHDCPARLPHFEHSISAQEQSAREPQLDRFIKCIHSEIHHPPQTRTDRQAARERITGAFKEFGTMALQLEDQHIRLMLEGGLSDVGTHLAREARRFDPSVNVADILQANRNAWTACSLQLLFGHQMRLSPAIFAYSMLYPYSDNYLDDAAVSADEKRGFSTRFGHRLKGDRVIPANAHESTIWRLVKLVECQYARDSFPQVFDSLMRIHRAQEQSIHLLRKGAASGDVDVLRLCFEKGGASVLADGYLAAGSLTYEQARFVFHWGVLLQLADDLQDVAEDRRNGVLTLFSKAAGHEPLDELTSRTLQYCLRVMLTMHGLPGTDCLALKQLIQRSCLSLIVRSAAEAERFYTAPYLEILESHSPFRFAFLNERRRQLAARSSLLVRLFEAFLAGEPDEPAFPWLPSSLMPRF